MSKHHLMRWAKYGLSALHIALVFALALSSFPALAGLFAPDTANAKVSIGEGSSSVGSNALQAAPLITSITSPNVDGAYGVGATITISVTVDQELSPSSSVQLTLDTNTVVSAGCASIPCTELSGVYTVGTGETSTDLTVTDINGTLADAGGTSSTSITSISDIPSGQNLGDNMNIVIAAGAPLITSPSTVYVLENTTAVLSATVAVTSSLPIAYSVVGGADQAKFTIDPTTGALSFVTAPDFNTPASAAGTNVYEVTIQAANNVGTDTQTINVTVTEPSAPIITSNGGGDTAAVNVLENTTSVLIPTVTVTSTMPITYSLVGGADQAKFTIDPTTGALNFVTPPDYETPASAALTNVYEVIIQASNSVGIDKQTINVTVTDEVVETTPTPTATATETETATATETETETATATETVTLFNIRQRYCCYIQQQNA